MVDYLRQTTLKEASIDARLKTGKKRGSSLINGREGGRYIRLDV